MILFLKHIAIEGPEVLEDFFRREGYATKTLELWQKPDLPKSLDSFEAVVSLGGPMNVYEEDQHPFLKREHVFIQEVLRREIPFLGICLGSQLLAKAANATVGKSPKKEVGFFPVTMTKEGKADRLFRGLSENFDVYQWHEDMFEIPKNGTLLARSTACPHQALKVGPRAYGLQFHIEITDVNISEWSDAYIKDGDTKYVQLKETMLKDYRQKKAVFTKTAEKIFQNFLEIVKEYQSLKDNVAQRSS